MGDKMFSKRYLLQALKKAGLPHTHQTLLKYEVAGIIPKSENPLATKNGAWRLYSAEEIKVIVEKIREYRSKR